MPSECPIIHPMHRNSTLKIRQNPKITGIGVPNSCKAKPCQFADDTTLI